MWGAPCFFDFNCPRHPGYFEVEVCPTVFSIAPISPEYKNGGAIFIHDPTKQFVDRGVYESKIPTKKDYEDFVLDCAHETAHLMHPFLWRATRELYLGLRSREFTQKEVNFREFFADYASLFFFKNYEPESFRASRRIIAGFPLLGYYEKGSESWRATLRLIKRNLTVKIFSRAPNLLPELAMQKPNGIAKFLIRHLNNP